MDWSSLLSSPAVVAGVAGLVSIITMYLTNRHARTMAEMQSRRDREKLRVDVRERRYDDRRDAVIALHEVAEMEAEKIDDHERDPRFGSGSPGDVWPEQSFSKLALAHARVAMLATPAVVDAADELRRTVVQAYYGSENHWVQYGEALRRYRTASRLMLSDETAADMPYAG